MRRYCLLLTVHCLLAAGTAAAAPALLRWQTDVARPQPRDWEVFAGETVVLAPVMTEGGAGVDLSGSTCALWYQTNGMAGAWWSVPAATGTVAGEVRATWSPTNDCGAARYNYFVAAASPAGTMYRAHGRLVMRHAPGATPSVLAAPTTLTDAMQAWADSRYDPAGAAQTVSNALASAVQAEAQARAAGDVVAMTNWQSIVFSITNDLAAAAAHAATDHGLTDRDGFQAGTEAYAEEGAAIGRRSKTSHGVAAGSEAYTTTDGTQTGDAINATQLGTGGNYEEFSLQIYTNKLLDADGHIPIARQALHDGDTGSHADIRAAIDAIPLPPTNAVAGWLVWDSGSNVYWRVTATNLRFYVWGVTE